MISTFIIAAQSLDGFISPKEHTTSLSWTSGADKEFFIKKTKETGVVVMGRTTFETIGKALPGRRTIVYTSRSLNIEGVETTSESPAVLLTRLEQEGHESVAICGGSSIYSLFLESGLVQKLYITLEPIVFGEGIPLFSKLHMKKLELISSTPLSQNTLLLEYQIII
ncbi:MAG: dihydrofolate reductase FolA [Candidatus Parcubacteria bacterium]|jgi:dihydrofolate reductase